MEKFAVAISISLLVLQQVCWKVAGVNGFYPHGTSEGDSTLQRSSGPGPSYQAVQLTQTAHFYGAQYSAITVSSNGVLILGDQTSSFSPEQEPQSFPASGAAIIAPFWARADYLSTSSRGKVYYRVSESSVLLDMAEQELAQAHGQANVNPSQLVIVTWKDLRSPTDNTGNTFQCIIVLSSSSTFVFFLYADSLMRWAGSPPAMVGFNAGDGAGSLTLPSSLTPAVLDVAQASNAGSSGKWLFRVDGSSVELDGLVVGLTQVTISVAEGNEFLLCATVLHGVIGGPLSLSLIATDVSTNGDRDYGRLSSLNFAPTGNMTRCQRVFTVGDSIYEYDEVFEIALSVSSSSEVILLPRTARITIIDNDDILVSYASETALEEDGEVFLTALLSNGECNYERPVILTYSMFPGDATDGVDYEGSNGTLTITPPTCRGRIRVLISDDTIFEEKETFFFSFSSQDNDRVRVTNTRPFANVTITDSDGSMVTVGITQTHFSTQEGGQVTVCTQMTSGQISQPLVVTLQTGHTTLLVRPGILGATDGQDLPALHEDLTFLPGQSSQLKCVNVTTYTDSLYEGTEHTGIGLTSNADVTLDPNDATLEILDSNEVSVTGERTQYSYKEGESEDDRLSICANLTGEIERDLHIAVEFHPGTATRFDFSDSRNGDVKADIPDIVFEVPDGSLSKNCNQGCKACTNVNIIDDPILEEKFEHFTLTLHHSDPAVHLSATLSNVTVEDNDAITITMMRPPNSFIELSEDDTTVPEICLERSGLSAVDVSVRALPHGITATVNEDFVGNENRITFSGSFDGSEERRCGEVSVSLWDDLVVEGEETLEILAMSDEPERIVVNNAHTITIRIMDNDDVAVNFTSHALNVSEGAGQVEVCAVVTGFSALPLDMSVITWPGSAVVGTDFQTQSLPLQLPVTDQALLDAMYNLPVSERLAHPLPVSSPVCVDVSIINDNVLELENVKSFFLNLSHPDNPSPITLAPPSSVAVSIKDDDNVTVLVDQVSSNISVTEGDAASLCARILGTADFPISAYFLPHAINDSAVGGVDFETAERLLSFPAHSTGLQCVDLPTVEDSVVERGEELWAELVLPEQASPEVALGSSVVSLTILDDDFVTVRLEKPEYSVLEGDGEVEVCAELTGYTDIPLTVFFSVLAPPQGERANQDYISVSNVQLFGELSENGTHRECVSILIVNDTILEDTEHFDVGVASPDSAVLITRETSRVYILDDDGVRVGLRQRTLTVPEGEGQATPICVEAVGRFEGSIEVTLQSQSESAQAGADFRPLSHILTFNPAQAEMQELCAEVSVLDDQVFEEDESFLVSLQVDHSGVSKDIQQTTVTVLDNDLVTIGLTTNQTSVPESVGVVSLCVRLTGLTERNVSYNMQVTSVEAQLNSDFHFTFDPLTHFTPQSGAQQVQCQQIAIEDDAILEDTEYFQVQLIPPVGVARVQVGVVEARVGITDDDTVQIGFTETDIVVDEDGSEEDRRVQVCVELLGQIDRAVSVVVTSQSVTADVQDYDVVSEEFLFAPGAAPLRCFHVFVLPDRLVEEREVFALVMSSNSEGVELQPAHLYVTITDQDVVCSPSSLDTSRGYFSWPETFPGDRAEVKCENGTATRYCSSSGAWGKPEVASCYVSTNELFRYIEKHGFSEDNLKELLFAVLQMVRQNETATVKYAEVVDQIFQEFLDQLDMTDLEANEELFGVVLEILNGLQTWPQGVLRQTGSSIVHSFESISEHTFRTDQFAMLSKTQHNISFYSEKHQVPQLFPEDEPTLRYFFAKNSAGDIEILSGDISGKASDYQASITFPKSLSDHLTGEEVGLVLSYYTSGTLFPLEANQTDEALVYITSVVAASFTGEDIRDLEEGVTVTMRLADNITSTANVTCVSWNFDENDGLGGWVTDGCELVTLVDREATCSCSHLTNFACLVEDVPFSASTDTVRPRSVPNTLSVLTIGGVCISLLALILTILTLLVFGKLRKRDSTKFRIQLCVAMILMLMFFAIGIYQVDTFEICVVSSALLHYFTLVSAMWMASDALLMLLKLTTVFSHPSTCYVVAVSLLSWVLPIPVVVAPIAINTDFTTDEEFCFISHTVVFFSAVLGPIAVLMFFTLLVFLVACCAVLVFSTSKYTNSKKASRRKGACSSMFSILGIMLLFGLTWAFGAFTIRGGPDYFRYLFVGFNSLQGFFVFLFFVAFAKETFDLWLQSCGCKKRKKRRTLLSAVTGVVAPNPKRMGLDKRADRLKAMEEADPDTMLGTNSWDITFFMPQMRQFSATLGSDAAAATTTTTTTPRGLAADTQQEQLPASRIDATCSSPRSEAPASPGTGPLESPGVEQPSETNEPEESNSLGRQQRSVSLSSGPSSVEPPESSLTYETAPGKGHNPTHSPTHSLDSAQNAMECMSTADSGILMDKVKSTPSPPPQLQHPQSGSTPRHVHSVSGIGYVSAESSMETLPQREEECYNIRREPITLAPSLRPRAVPNDYATVDVDNLCA